VVIYLKSNFRADCSRSFAFIVVEEYGEHNNVSCFFYVEEGEFTELLSSTPGRLSLSSALIHAEVERTSMDHLLGQ
jgi:hypothetical protein